MKKQPALFLLSLTLSALSQSPSDAALLQRLAAQSAAYRASLPNFNCEESVVTTTRHGDTIDWKVDFTATLRVLRNTTEPTAPADTLRETYTINTYLGMPLDPTTTPRIPLYVQGGFGKGVPSFFSAGQQSCYRYKVSAGGTGFANRVSFAGQPGPAPCDAVHPTNGFATLDPEGNVIHGETRLALKEAEKYELTTFASVDYASINLDGRPFRLPIHLYAEKRDGKELYTFDAHYTNCKLFRAKVTISPAPAQ